MMFTIENFVVGLQNILPRIKIEKTQNEILLSRVDNETQENESIGKLSIEEIQAIADSVKGSATFNECVYFDKIKFEIPVKSQDRMRMPPFRFFESDLYSVYDHNCGFSIDKASPQYIFTLLCFSAMNSDISTNFFPLHRIMMIKGINSFEDLSDVFHILTAKITMPTECSLSEFKRMLQSYLFNIAYNNNLVFTTANLFEDRQPLRHSVRREGQLFPYKSYNPELLKYYYQGAATDLPFTQYLAFYHVAEFFFQAIAEQDAFQEIENFITRPSFSPYRKDDIRQFYNKIKKKMRIQREDGVWDEKTGLLLCLKKYIPDVETLKNAIISIDPSAVDYYENNDVPFTDEGKSVNFADTTEAIYSVIRNRVYSVRNAIVHSKEGERLRYEPFKNDKDLLKEIPLIRAIAEEIIINSSKPMEIRYSE